MWLFYYNLFMKPTVYFISGLGANEKAFSFLDISFCNPVFVQWITPLPKETLPEYALRLKQQIKDPKAFVVGLSFGGMLATEMAKQNPAQKTILISSNKTTKEFPKLLKLGKYIPVYKWISDKRMKKSSPFVALFLGATGKAEKLVQLQIVKDTNPQFTKWAIEAILHWKNMVTPNNIIHIHGTADKLLPYSLVKANYTINGGTHLMIMDRAKEISDLLKEIIHQ